ncbi:hypothetical protein ACHAPU_000206 [Fusarium lateritium]
MPVQRKTRARASNARRNMRPYQGKHKPIGFVPPTPTVKDDDDDYKEREQVLDYINVSTESEGISKHGSKTSGTSATVSTTEDGETNNDSTAENLLESITVQAKVQEPGLEKALDSMTLGTNPSVDKSVQNAAANNFDLFYNLPEDAGFNEKIALSEPAAYDNSCNNGLYGMPSTSVDYWESEAEHWISLLEEQRRAEKYEAEAESEV